MSKKILGLVFLVVAVTGVLWGCQGSNQDSNKPIKLKLLSSWGTENAAVRANVLPLVDRINERAGGQLEVSWVGPEAIPPFEQLEAVTSGVFDLLFTSPAYHAGDIAIGISVDTISASSQELRKSGLYELIDEAYQEKENLKLLAMDKVGSGYEVVLKDKKIAKADLSGLKIRATPFYAPLIEALGGVVVSSLPTTEIYSALEKGVIDGSTWMALGPLDAKLYEVAKYQLRPLYGESTLFVLANMEKWQTIPQDLQELIMEVAREVENESRDVMAEQFKKEEKQLVELGLEIVELPPAEAQKFLDTFHERTWQDLVIKQDPVLGPKAKEIADKFPRN